MYPYHATNQQEYFFLTDYGITYVVEFSDASAYFNPSCLLCSLIETINFSQVGPGFVKIKDNKIGPTVAEIIKSKCRSNNGAVIFVCDPSDKRDMCRSRLFDFWDSKFNNGQFYVERAIITHNTGALYIGLIVEKANLNAQSFLTEFTNTMDDIEQKLN